MKVNFKEISVEASFGEYLTIDMTKEIGNYIHAHTTDIGLDDTARAIYHSEGEMEINEEHAASIVGMMEQPGCPFLAFAKRAVINELTPKNNGNE